MKSYIWAAALAGVITAGGAQAADLYQAAGYKDGPVVLDSWPNAGDILVRLRGLAVLPQTSTDHWSTNVTALNPNVSITDSAIPELDLTYFFTKNIAAELVLGVTPHTVNGTGGIAPFRQSWRRVAFAADAYIAISLRHGDGLQALRRRRRELHDLLR